MTLCSPLCGVSELALVDDEAGIEVAGENLGDDAIEGHSDGLDSRARRSSG